jgi:2-amino-4-hydroxy-6-hydroxymethyldihydropteridine diphosphokinase
MRALLAIEARFGRVRSERNAPRTLDLDVLWVEGQRAHVSGPDAPEIEVPHPRLHERAFAMIPMLEVVPGATDPVSGKLYAEILSEVGTA